MPNVGPCFATGRVSKANKAYADSEKREYSAEHFSSSFDATSISQQQLKATKSEVDAEVFWLELWWEKFHSKQSYRFQLYFPQWLVKPWMKAFCFNNQFQLNNHPVSSKIVSENKDEKCRQCGGKLLSWARFKRTLCRHGNFFDVLAKKEKDPHVPIKGWLAAFEYLLSVCFAHWDPIFEFAVYSHDSQGRIQGNPVYFSGI